MKRLYLLSSMLLVLLHSTMTKAYYLDFSFTGDMSFSSTTSSFVISGSAAASSLTTIEPTPADDGSGGVNVSWTINSDGSVADSQSGQLIFAFLSDYGNTNPTPVDVSLSGTGWWDDNMDMCNLICASDYFWAYITNDYGGSQPDHNTSVSESLSLLTNTYYTVSGEAFASANSYAEGLPGYFPSWEAFTSFYGSEQQNFIGSAYGASYVDYSLNIISVEEVPVPPAVWLFGSGFFGLIGFARRKKA